MSAKSRYVRAVSSLVAGMCLFPMAVHAQSTASDYTYATRYDAAGRVVGTIAPDPDGGGALAYAAVRNTYDNAGRLVKVETGELSSWQSEFIAPSAWGTAFTILSTIEATFDALDRKTKDVVKGSDGVIISVTQYSYDSVGRLECTALRMNQAEYQDLPTSACALDTTGASGPDRIVKNIYDAAGQILQVRKAVGTSIEIAEATYTYTMNGKRQYVIDAVGNKAELRYDGFDRLSRWVFSSTTKPSAYNPSSPANAVATAGALNENDYEEYGYDPSGNRTSFRKRDGSTLTYEYDALDRMTKKVVPDRAGLAATHERDVFYGYDARGLQTYVRFDSSSGEGTTNVYDGFGRLTVATVNMDGQSRQLSFLYDKGGNRTQITWPDSAYLTMGYDGLDRLGIIKDASPAYLITWDYNNRGLPASADRRGTPPRQDFTYDPAGRLAMLAIPNGPTPMRVTWTYARNPAGQIASETRTNDAYAWGGHANVNRGYTANGLNQYTAAGPAAFCYDANGNLTADGSNVYKYDVENRLVEKRVQTNTNCASLSYTGPLQVSLRYNPLGRLYEVVGGGSTTRFLYDGDALVGEYNVAGTLLRRYGHGNGAGADDPLIWFEGASALSANARYLYPDPRGSIVRVDEASGNSLAINSYDEYGIPGSANLGRFQYTGQTWLAELGMYYYKARIYSPTLGRFLQIDPLGFGDQVNMYTYVQNDPVNLVDPTGWAKVCTDTPGSRIKTCVEIDADIDDDGKDDLSRSQLTKLGSDFRDAILANSGADFSALGKPVQGTAGNTEKAITSVVTQFIGGVLSGDALANWNGNVRAIWADKRSYFGAAGWYADGDKSTGPRRTGRIRIGPDPGFFSGSIYGSPSDLARSLLHEALHSPPGPEIDHTAVDRRARALLRRSGLGGGGCSAIGLGFSPAGFPGC